MDKSTISPMQKFFRNNGLSIVFFALFLLALCGQIITGYKEHNKEREDDGQAPISAGAYLSSGHFLQATFENWESEFLQMALFVVLTISLRQKGSSESKKCDGPEEVDREPSPTRKGAPWPVVKGGIYLKLYKHSLTIVLTLLFILSFIMHFYGSFKDENEQLLLKGKPVETMSHYLTESRFWFESFQNWQSEFLSVFAIVVFSIFLRQKGSPQSKPVDASNDETGE
jgi:Na+-transporting methylmalonyl-CoA/oxaloacetate decarboxylase gamma subunit